jgi:hypothetical protein
MIRAGTVAVLAAIAQTSCANSAAPVMGAVCESYKSPVKNALAQYVERQLFGGGNDGDSPSTGYRLNEGNRQRLIAVMKETKAFAASPRQECEPVGEGICRVRVHCRENVLNATNTPTTFTLVLEERTGVLEPIQLLRRFDNNDPDPISGKVEGGLLFRYLRSKDMETRLRQIAE